MASLAAGDPSVRPPGAKYFDTGIGQWIGADDKPIKGVPAITQAGQPQAGSQAGGQRAKGAVPALGSVPVTRPVLDRPKPAPPLIQPPVTAGFGAAGAGPRDVFRPDVPLRNQQSYLRSRGYLINVDGVAGPETQSAITALLKGIPGVTWTAAWAQAHPATRKPSATTATAAGGGATDTSGAVGSTAAGGADAGSSTFTSSNPYDYFTNPFDGVGAFPTPPTSTPFPTLQPAPGFHAPPVPTLPGAPQHAPLPSHTALLAQAAAIVNGMLNPQVMATNQQAAQARAQTLQDVATQRGFAEAAAKMLGDSRAATQANYQAAADAEAGYGKGYSTDLQNRLEAAQAQDNADLAKIGPGAGAAGPNPQDVADVAYGTGGAIPASMLATQGAAAAAYAGTLPATQLGIGQQEVGATLAGGRATQAQFGSQLAQLEAQRPGLLAQALDQVEGLALQKKSLLDDESFRDYQAATQGILDAYQLKYGKASAEYQAAVAKVNSIDQQKIAQFQALVDSKKTGYDAKVQAWTAGNQLALEQATQQGHAVAAGQAADANTINLAKLDPRIPGTPAWEAFNRIGLLSQATRLKVAQAQAKYDRSQQFLGMTPAQYQSLIERANEFAKNAHDGFTKTESVAGPDGKLVATNTKFRPLSWDRALLEGSYLPLEVLLPALSKWYTPGDRGRPKFDVGRVVAMIKGGPLSGTGS